MVPTSKTLTIMGVTYTTLFNNDKMRVLYEHSRARTPYVVQFFFEGSGWTTIMRLRSWQALKLAGSITTNVAIYNTEDR